MRSHAPRRAAEAWTAAEPSRAELLAEQIRAARLIREAVASVRAPEPLRS